MAKQAIFEKKNILVTGGAGFIGSHLCDQLVQTGKVICVDNFVSSQRSNIEHLLQNPNFILVNHDMATPLDLTAYPELEQFRVEFQGVQEVYHLACPTSPKNFMDQRMATLDANCLGMKYTLDLAKQYNAKSILLSGGVAANMRLREKFNSQLTTYNLQLMAPPVPLCTDNAGYIGSYAHFRGKPVDWHEITATPDLTVEVT